jgi:hypothetical protein
MTDTIDDQGVYASAERWATLRADAAFIELMRLARVVNSLTLAYPPIFVTLTDQSPRARRERFAAMLYAAALLHEGLHTAQGLGQHFRDMPQYKDGFASILADPRIRILRSQVLDRIRDELVFHFDRTSLSKGLDAFPPGEVLIATSTDFRQGETYFDLADEALLGALFGDAPTVEEYVERLGQFLEDVTLLFNRFMRASHTLIPAALSRMGCHVKPFRRPDPIADDAG